MKIIALILLLSLLAVGNAQVTQKAESLSPEDFGAHKWVLSATAGKGEVVVFRVTTIRKRGNSPETEIYDSVRYQPDKESKETAFFYDPGYFDMERTEEPNWFWKALGGTGWIRGEWDGSKTGGKKFEIHFESEQWGRTEKYFEVLILPYNEVKVLHPELPQIEENISWGWSGFHPKS
jgi:hypothetical protein